MVDSSAKPPQQTSKHQKLSRTNRNYAENLRSLQVSVNQSPSINQSSLKTICSVSLDPDEDIPDPNLYVGFLNFLDNDLTSEERNNFFNRTLKCIVKRALSLKQWKPRGGLHFSLQQQRK